MADIPSTSVHSGTTSVSGTAVGSGATFGSGTTFGHGTTINLGALDYRGRSHTLSDMQMLESLLLRKWKNREDFWLHSSQTSKLPHICCKDKDVQVYIKTSDGGASRHEIFVFDSEKKFKRALLYENRAERLFVFIEARDQDSGKLSLNCQMFCDMVTILDVMPQFTDFLPSRSKNQKCRDSSTGDFVLSTKNGAVEICLSLYHGSVQQSKAGDKKLISVTKAISYTQMQENKLRWILVGSPDLNQLQSEFLSIPHLGHHKIWSTYIIFIAINGWQFILNSIEDDLNAELDAARDPTSNSGHTGLINALFRLQNQISNAKWQIDTNISVLRSLKNLRAGPAFDRLEFTNVELLQGAVEELERRANRAEFLARQVHDAIKQATRVAAHAHATGLETFSWHNLKLNYAVESGTRQTTVIFAVLAPAIFTSTFFSTNFFSLSENGTTLLSHSLWIWFATTVPLTVIFFCLIWVWSNWRTKVSVRSARERTQNVPPQERRTRDLEKDDI